MFAISLQKGHLVSLIFYLFVIKTKPTKEMCKIMGVMSSSRPRGGTQSLLRAITVRTASAQRQCLPDGLTSPFPKKVVKETVQGGHGDAQTFPKGAVPLLCPSGPCHPCYQLEELLPHGIASPRHDVPRSSRAGASPFWRGDIPGTSCTL